jgi:hypothetical protein
MSRWSLPVLLSLVVPGLGQLYNRSWVKGVVLLVATTWLSGRMTVEALGQPLLAVSLSKLTAYLVVLLALWCWAVWDAHHVAQARRAS